MTKSRNDVLIVGAGAAGLAAAEALSRGGASVVVLEARRRAGGRVWTRRRHGWPLPVELGAEFVHGRNEELLDIARDAALLLERVPDRHIEASASGWKAMKGIWKKFDAVTRTMRRTGKDRSVAEFLESRPSLSSDRKRMVRGLVEGYHSAFVELASEHALSTAGDRRFAPDEEAQFRVLSGYDGVTGWLRSRVDPKRCRFVFSAPARRLRWRRGDVELTTQDGRAFRARRAIVTAPVGVLEADPGEKGAIVLEPDPPALRRALAGIETGHVVRIVLRFREAFWEEHEEGDSLAFLHSWGRARFPTWWTAAPAEVPMLTGWAGGHAAAALLRVPRGQLLDRAIESVELLFEVPASRLRRLLVGWDFHDWTRDPYSRGAYSYVAVGGAGAPRALARPIADTLYFAGEATEPDENGTVPGAISSGRRAARLILRG